MPISLYLELEWLRAVGCCKLLKEAYVLDQIMRPLPRDTSTTMIMTLWVQSWFKLFWHPMSLVFGAFDPDPHSAQA